MQYFPQLEAYAKATNQIFSQLHKDAFYIRSDYTEDDVFKWLHGSSIFENVIAVPEDKDYGVFHQNDNGLWTKDKLCNKLTNELMNKRGYIDNNINMLKEILGKKNPKIHNKCFGNMAVEEYKDFENNMLITGEKFKKIAHSLGTNLFRAKVLKTAKVKLGDPYEVYKRFDEDWYLLGFKDCIFDLNKNRPLEFKECVPHDTEEGTEFQGTAVQSVSN